MRASVKWLHQRITALILFIVAPFLIYKMFYLNLKDFFAVKNFINDFLNAFCFFVIIAVGLYHGYLGIYSIVTDYIKNKKLIIFLLHFAKLFFLLLVMLSFYYLFLSQDAL
jgi:succinate dehydrogenase hydrophobic membrane anchor protein